MNTFGIGFLAGFFANWAFGILARALPATWVRFVVRIGNPSYEKGLAGGAWVAPVTIAPPRWKRVLMVPLQEYLVAEVSLDGTTWMKTKWDRGDTAETMLRADGAMSIPIALFSYGGSTGWYLGDRFGERDYSVVHPLDIIVRVVRSLDSSIADKVIIPATFQDGSWILCEAQRDR